MPSSRSAPVFERNRCVRSFLCLALFVTLLASGGPVLAAPPGGSDGRIALKTLPGFTGEELLAAGPEDGSWSAMAIDPRGRIVISPQDSEPMLRVTLGSDGSASKIEKLPVPPTSAMGLLFAYDSLYVNGMGPQGFGLYRLRTTKPGDEFDEPKLLRSFEGEVSKEHGSHGLTLGPDGLIYLAQGNHVRPPTDARPDSPFRNAAEDQLLPSANYGLSSGDRAQAPCGHVLRMDPDGHAVEIVAGGLRNIYDLAFDARGELFTFDSDTEFNWGLPWYVPTRILHLVSGGDYGFREGTGKWPTAYADTLPAVVNVGLGCPTGVRFGTASHFPEKYRRALFALDWTFGRILAVHLEPKGASFAGSFETFLQGRPLNLTALAFGPDGALYFITGGRKTRSALYRVRYTGTEAPGSVAATPGPEIKERRALEALQGSNEAAALDRAWPDLGSEDRFLRQAARLALEARPVAEWSARALAEKEPQTALTALLALARLGRPADRAEVLARLAKWWPALPTEALQLDALRVAEVALARSDRPWPETKNELLSALDVAYPAASPALNRELCQLLIALEAPRVVPRTLALLSQAPTLEEQLHYVFHLRLVRAGWSRPEREAYFRWFLQPPPATAHPPEVKRWFAEVNLHYADGGSLLTYLTNIRAEAAATLTDAERQALGSLLESPIATPVAPVATKPHSFVKEWTTADLLSLMKQLRPPRSAGSGREVFTAAGCIACHRYANEGGAVGPDLNAVAYKLGPRDLIESITEPSKVISDQFQNTLVELTDGSTRLGRILKRDKNRILLSVNPLGPEREEIPRAKIRALEPSPISPMPPGLLNNFTSEEILDLLAYLGFGAD